MRRLVRYHLRMSWRLFAGSVFTLAVGLGLASCGAVRGVVQPFSQSKITPLVYQRGVVPVNWVRFAPKTTSGKYQSIALASDMALWFTDPADAKIIRIANNGLTKAYPIKPPQGVGDFQLAAGADGKTYVTAGSYIAQVATGGTTKYYAVPTGETAGSNGIVNGPDGNVWFLESKHVAKITPAGVVTEYAFKTSIDISTFHNGITVGSDGNLWFGEGDHIIGTIVPGTGAITEYDVHAQGLPLCDPGGIGGLTLASDKNVWFDCSGNFGIITKAGAASLVSNAWGMSLGAQDVASGPDRQVWFVGGQNGVIGEIDPLTLALTAYIPPVQTDAPLNFALGHDGNWWTTTQTGHIDVYVLKVLSVSPSSIAFTGKGQNKNLTVAEAGVTAWTASSTQPSVATVAPGTASNVFVVTSVGSGKCVVIVQDSIGNSFQVKVTVP